MPVCGDASGGAVSNQQGNSVIQQRPVSLQLAIASPGTDVPCRGSGAALARSAGG